MTPAETSLAPGLRFRGSIPIRPNVLVPAVAGFFWLWAEIARYPSSFLFVPDASVWVAQLGLWLWIVGQASIVAALLWLLVRFLPPSLFELGKGRRFPATGLVVVSAVTLLGAWLRCFWFESIPPVPWTDMVVEIDVATKAGRFLWPHEVIGGPAAGAVIRSRNAASGLAVDWVRILLLASPDREVAVAAISAAGGCLLPLLAWLLARRLSDGRTALAAAFFTAVGFWPLVMGRVGEIEQTMSVVVLLAMERTAAGLEDDGHFGALAAGGLFAALSLHTYLAAYPCVAAMVVWIFLESRRCGRLRALGAFFVGALPFLAPLVFLYARRPELFLGGARDRIASGRVWSGPLDGFLKWIDHVGLLFWTGDPLSRHAREQSPPLTLIEVVLLVFGLVAILERGARRSRRWLGVGLVSAALFASGALGNPRNLSPNSLRTALVGVFAALVIAEGVSRLASSPRFSRGFAVLAVPLLCGGIGLWNVTRLLDWAFPGGLEPNFAQAASYAGKFVAVAGRERVLVDPAIFREHSTPVTAAFQIGGSNPLEPLVPPRVGRIDLRGASGSFERPAEAALYDWYVTLAEPEGFYFVEIGHTESPNEKLRAVSLCRPPLGTR